MSADDRVPGGQSYHRLSAWLKSDAALKVKQIKIPSSDSAFTGVEFELQGSNAGAV